MNCRPVSGTYTDYVCADVCIELGMVKPASWDACAAQETFKMHKDVYGYILSLGYIFSSSRTGEDVVSGSCA